MTYARELSEIAAAITVDGSKNIGIGTATPTRKLDVRAAYTTDTIVAQIGNTNNGNGSTPVATIFDFTEANGTSVSRISSIYTQSAGTTSLAFGTYGGGSLAERMRIDSSGNVGIGTSSPTNTSGYKTLEIVGTSSTTGGMLRMKTSDASVSSLDFTDSNGRGIFTISAHPVRFGTNDTERMRIDSSGNLLVGTTTNYNARQSIGFAGTAQNGVILRNTDASGAPSMMLFQWGATTVGSIGANGSSTSYNTSSDYRLKEDVAPMTGALDKVSALKPVTYKWKLDGSDGQGFIAHELAEVVPDCVTGEKDAVDAEGKPVYQGIDTSFLVATLTAAIQEQQAIINNLTNRLTALENK